MRRVKCHPFCGSVLSRCLIVLSLLVLATPASAQRDAGQLVRLDSVIYTNPEPAPPYPFDARRNSLRAALDAKCDSARATTEADWVPECHWPTYFYEPRLDARLADVPGGWPEVQPALERELPVGFVAVVTADVAWDGSILNARLRAYRGDLSEVDVAGLIRRLRLAPIGHFDFPTLERASFSVPFRGRAADERG